ncbi:MULTISPECIES: sugar phosphate isomerase/epimerase family protein [Oceanobacillus]|uniref:Sugar phosphate isomerase/epimerase family protein n=1 Tax=Oceanobacillus aidingensis TaxID=645964 RepID=A0ABV9JS79_9BACI|nr:sugar phosphate isomerase/epimerase family protein [Oceanobacillus oncorhynchi]MDM8099085.1 sugar phosphate isomerase/epimerase family protein [Oceanobacillus oncorhynchi]
MLKGINQWCYPEGTSLEKVLEYSKEAGFETVELNVNPSGGIGLTVDSSADDAKKIKSIIEAYDLEIKSISTALLWQFPLSSPDEAVRARGRAIVEKQIELAAAMDVDTVLVVPGIVSEEVTYDQCYQRSQKELRKVLPLAEKHQVHIGIENVWNKFLLSPLEMSRYVDELDSEYAGVYFDIGNVLQFGYPEQWIRILGSRICKVHVKDFNTSVGNITGFVPLLAGDVNWQAISKALKELGYKGPLTAELSPYKLDTKALAVDTAKHIELIIDAG